MSSDQQFFVDGLSNGKIVADKENAWHGQARRHARTGEPRNRLAIVGQQDRGVLRRPLQDRRQARPLTLHPEHG